MQKNGGPGESTEKASALGAKNNHEELTMWTYSENLVFKMRTKDLFQFLLKIKS